MMSSLKCQARLLLTSAATTCLMMALFIPYALLTGNQEIYSFIYAVQATLMVAIMGLVFLIMNTAIVFPQALGFGATRRGWFSASLITKAVYTLLLCLLLVYGFIPLSARVYGEAAAIGPAWLPLMCAGVWLLTSAGELLGHISRRFGAKGLVIGIIAGVVLIVGAILFIALQFDNGGFAPFFRGPLFIALLAGASVLLQAACWPLLKNAAAV